MLMIFFFWGTGCAASYFTSSWAGAYGCSTVEAYSGADYFAGSAYDCDGAACVFVDTSFEGEVINCLKCGSSLL